MAAGLAGDVDPADGLTLRLYESSGSAATARVRLIGGLGEPEVTTVLEEAAAGQPAITVDGTDLVVALAPADVVTIGARPAGTGRPARIAAPATEAAQPVFTRYWLHDKGPAPVGNLPVSVYVQPAALDLSEPSARGTVKVTVASATVAAAGQVGLDLPAGLTVKPDGPYDYDLAAGEHTEFTLTVTAGDVSAGRYFLAAQIGDNLGQILEDTVAITVGGTEADETTGPVEAVLEPTSATVSPGGDTTLTLRLTNRARSEVRGEARLLSPYGTWGEPDDDLAVTPHAQGFAVPAGGTAALTFAVHAPATARPGSRYWALAMIGCFGRVSYTPTVSLACDQAAPPAPSPRY
jgi:hypothetical protein